MFLRTVVFFVCVSVALAYTELMPQPPKPDKYKNVEGCYIEESDVVIPFGSSLASKQRCVEYLCGSSFIEIVGCGSASFTVNRSECSVVEDKEKPYPGCCPAIKCRRQ